MSWLQLSSTMFFYRSGIIAGLEMPIQVNNYDLFGSKLRLEIQLNRFDGSSFQHAFNYWPYGVEFGYDKKLVIVGDIHELNRNLQNLRFVPPTFGGMTTATVALFKFRSNYDTSRFSPVDQIGYGTTISFMERSVIGQSPAGPPPYTPPPTQTPPTVPVPPVTQPDPSPPPPPVVSQPVMQFSVEWVTDDFPGVSEGDTVDLALNAITNFRFTGPNPSVFVTGDQTFVAVNSATVSDVRVNGTPRAFSQEGNVLTFAPVKDTDSVEVRFSDPQPKIFLHVGPLPEGLRVEGSRITGRIGALQNAKIGVVQDFKFSLRANTGLALADKQFVLRVTPISDSIDDPQFVAPQPSNNVTPIGVYTRGAPISYVIQTTAPNGVAGTLVEAASDETTEEAYSGLPAGVVLQPSGVVTGIIDPTTAISHVVGNVKPHHFAVTLRNSRGVDVETRKFSLIVAAPSGPLAPLRFVRWRTPPGTVGTFYEGEVCPVGIRAYSTTGEAITYSILTSTPLPAGITIDADTGDLQGVFSHVSSETEITFTARAAVGATFVDREFSLTVLPRYNSSGAVNVSFRLRRNEAVPMIADYEPLIPAEDFFRPADPNFGELKEPVIYVVGGLRKSDSANMEEGPDLEAYPEPVEYVAASIRNSKFGGPVKLRLGEHKVAVVKIGSTVVYEVLYREVVDPLVLAGGFKLNNRGEPEREVLPHPQSSRYLYPESIQNLRYDLALQVGFDAFDPTQNTKLGVNSPENLPMWMKTPQVGNQQSSVIGFVPAMVVAYLKPGAGQRALDKLSLRTFDAPHPLDDPNPLAKNHEVSFDQYYLSYDSISEATSFDDGQTTFDGDETRFDEYAYQKGKYQRMNPKGGN